MEDNYYLIKIENLGDTFFYTKESFKNLPAWIRAQSEFADNPNQEHDKISRRQWKELSKNLGGMLNSGSDAMALGVGRISGETVLTIKPGAVLYGSVSEITQRYEDLKEEVRNSANLVTSIGLAKGMEVVGNTKTVQKIKQGVSNTVGKILPSNSAKSQLQSLGIKVEEKRIGVQVDGTTIRGLEIDDALGNNLGRTFKTFDNFDETTKTATSVKSIDMDSKTYLSGSRLSSKLNKDLKAIENFTEYSLKGTNLSRNDIEERVLKIVINNKPLNTSQMENLKKVVTHATEEGIRVEAVILK